MLIQRLKEYAERNLAEALDDPAFEPQPVHWLLVIGPDGRFHQFEETNGGTVRRGKKEYRLPKEYRVPKSPAARSSATSSFPLLTVDTVAYVFGPGPWTKGEQEPKEQRHHEAFKALLKDVADETGDPGLKACVAFYANPAGYPKAREALEKEKHRPGSRYAFRLVDDSQPVFLRTAVRVFWREHFRTGMQARLGKGATARCLSCGQSGPILPTHDKVKGIPGGQPSGLSLVSFDKEAFTSLGWGKGANAGICAACATAYVRALNHILNRKGKPVRSDGTPTGAGSVLQSGVVFAFWMKEPDTFTLGDLLEAPTPESVERLFQVSPVGLQADADAFYAIALSANGGRVVVREWIETTVAEARSHLGQWFNDLHFVLANDQRRDGTVVRVAGEAALPPSLRDLCRATARETDDVMPNVPVDLVRAALKGTPLSTSSLEACLRRTRLGREGDSRNPKFTPARIGLIRCALNRSRKEGDPLMEAFLVRDCRDPGYLCGRLLAILGRLQWLAIGKVDATVVDRFYGRASVAPQLVFPTLLKLARHHVAKANDKWPGSGTNAEKEMEEILSLMPRRMDRCPDFPTVLDLAQQGRFAIGFYHQQAWHRLESRRKKEEQPGIKDLQEATV